MTRSFIVPGETLIAVRGGAHMSGGPIGDVSELGLAVEEVRVIPQFSLKDIRVDDFGPDVPAEVMWMLASVRIQATLIHFDSEVLDTMLDETMGGPGFNVVAQDLIIRRNRILAPGGLLLGGRKPMYASGNHFFSVTLNNTFYGSGNPWRFRKCHLMETPVIFPVGTNAQACEINIRAIPYWSPVTVSVAGSGEGQSTLTVLRKEIQSSGAVLWDRRPNDED